MNHHEMENPQVGQAVQDNIVASFVLNYLDELDQQLEEPCVKVMRLKGKATRYWLDGAQKMSPDCFRELSYVLRVPISQEEEQMIRSLIMMDNVGATQFFQSTVKDLEAGDAAIAGAGRRPEDGRPGEELKMSVSQMYPGLGMSSVEYEVGRRDSGTHEVQHA